MAHRCQCKAGRIACQFLDRRKIGVGVFFSYLKKILLIFRHWLWPVFFAKPRLEYPFLYSNQKPCIYHAAQPVPDVLFTIAVIMVGYCSYLPFCGLTFSAHKFVNRSLFGCHLSTVFSSVSASMAAPESIKPNKSNRHERSFSQTAGTPVQSICSDSTHSSSAFQNSHLAR